MTLVGPCRPLLRGIYYSICQRDSGKPTEVIWGYVLERFLSKQPQDCPKITTFDGDHIRRFWKGRMEVMWLEMLGE